MNIITQRYVVHEQLGAGGMGVVLRATDRLTQQAIALKQVTVPVADLQFNSRASNDDFSLALSREFSILATLRHPHIVSVLDYGFDDQRCPFLTMHLLEHARPITEVEADDVTKVRYVAEVLQAMVYLHRRGVLHLDLKPANVLVSDDRAYLVDFGLAVGYDEQVGMGGTLAYMAPELLHMKPPSVASDLYALGLMAYELFTGVYPYRTDGPITDLIHDILNTEPDLERLPLPLQGWLWTLLSKKPIHRPASALDALDNLVAVYPAPIALDTVAAREGFLQAAAFVGREAELGELKAAAKAMTQGQGGLWLIGGESGVGKSRLLLELRICALVDEVRVIQGNAAGLPLQLWRDILPPLLLEVEVTDGDAGVLLALVPHLDQLLGRPIASASEIDPRAANRRLMDTITTVVGRVTRPLLILAEDLHADELNTPILRNLMQVLPNLPILVVGSFQTDVAPRLHERFSMAHALFLERLTPTAMAALSTSMLGPAGGTAPVVELLQHETEGNAYFVVEVVRALAEATGDFYAVGTRTLPEMVMAGGVQAVLQRRLNHLEAADRDLLNVAAVAGRRLDLGLLAHLHGSTLEGWLLRANEVAVLEVRDNVWQFSHSRLREAALASLEPDLRARLHGEVAQGLEAVYPEQIKQLAVVLSDHYHTAGQLERARHHAYQVVRTSHAYAIPDAARMAQRILAAPEAVTPSMLGWAQICLLFAEASQGDSNAFANAQAFFTDIYASDDLELVAQAASAYVDISNFRMVPIEVAPILALLERMEGHEIPEATLLQSLGIYHSFRGQVTEAIGYLERAIALRPHAVAALIALGNSYKQSHQPERAVDIYERAYEASQAASDLFNTQMAVGNLGTAYMMMNRFEEATDCFEQATAIAREIGFVLGIGAWAANTGESALAMGDYARAQVYLQQAVENAAQTHAPARQARRMSLLADVDAQLGDLDRAWQTVQAASELIDSLDAPLEKGMIYYRAAIIAFMRGDVATAATYAERSATTDSPEDAAYRQVVWGIMALLAGQDAAGLAALAQVPADSGVPIGLARLVLVLVQGEEPTGAVADYVAALQDSNIAFLREQRVLLRALGRFGEVSVALAALDALMG